MSSSSKLSSRSTREKLNKVEVGGIQLRIKFYSYYKDVTGCGETVQEVHAGSSIGELLSGLKNRFPKLAAEQSALVAVGLDYQPRTYVLQNGDEVSIFPPVQGG